MEVDNMTASVGVKLYDVIVNANLWRGIEAVGGKIKVDSEQFLFVPHPLNIQTQKLILNMSEIVSIEKRNSALIIPNGLKITTSSGQTYKFVAWNRNKLISFVNMHIN